MSLHLSHFASEGDWLNIISELPIAVFEMLNLFITDLFPCSLMMFADLESRFSGRAGYLFSINSYEIHKAVVKLLCKLFNF